MAVFDASWWSVWWPWLLLRGLTAASLLATVAIPIAHRRGHHTTTGPHLTSTSFYLDEKEVMDLYHKHSDKYKGVVHRKVREQIIRNRKFSLSTLFAWIGDSTHNEVSTDEVRDFTEEAKPKTVIGMVIDALEREDNIVDVDLLKK